MATLTTFCCVCNSVISTTENTEPFDETTPDVCQSCSDKRDDVMVVHGVVVQRIAKNVVGREFEGRLATIRIMPSGGYIVRGIYLGKPLQRNFSAARKTEAWNFFLFTQVEDLVPADVWKQLEEHDKAMNNGFWENLEDLYPHQDK